MVVIAVIVFAIAAFVAFVAPGTVSVIGLIAVGLTVFALSFAWNPFPVRRG